MTPDEIAAKVLKDAKDFETKEALKEALKEWMDERFATLGRWSLVTIAIAAMGAIVYFVLIANGWRPPVG